MKVLNKVKSSYCGNVCLTDEMKGSFFILADFMLGDVDVTKIQGSFKRITKEMINIVLALEVAKDKYTEDMIYTEYLDIPYSESSYWSFQGYQVLYLDKNSQVFEVTLQFEGDEIYFIQAEKIKR